jgi:hypothetical protein
LIRAQVDQARLSTCNAILVKLPWRRLPQIPAT